MSFPVFVPPTEMVRDSYIARRTVDTMTVKPAVYTEEFEAWVSQHDTNIRNAVLALHPIMAMPSRHYGDKDPSGCAACHTYGECPTRLAITRATTTQSQVPSTGVEQ